MVFDVGYDLSAVFDFGRLQIHELVGECRIFKIPQVDAVIIGGQK